MKEEGIKNIDFNILVGLTDFIPEIKKARDFGEIDIKEINDLTFYGGFKYSDLIQDYIKYCYDENIVVNFDWMNWEEGYNFMNSENRNYSEKNFSFLIKLNTYHLRRDRFSDGWLLEMFKQGEILKLLERIEGLIFEYPEYPK